MFGGPGNGERPSIFKNQNDRLACSNNIFKQMFLVSRKVEALAVEAFAGDSLPLAEGEDDDIGGLCDADGFFNVRTVVDGNVRCGEKGAQAVSNADALAIFLVLIVAIAGDGGIGSDKRNVACSFGEWQEAPAVFEQRHRLASRLEREIQVLPAPLHARRERCVGVRMIEKSESELGTQHRRHCAIEGLCVQRTIFLALHNGVLKFLVAEVVKLHVDAGVDGLHDGVFRVGGDVVIFPQAADGAEIG